MWSSGMNALSFISSINLHQDIPYGFPSFSKHQRDGLIHCPPLRMGSTRGYFSPALCLSYELAVVKEAAQCFQLPELPHTIFCAMLLNEVERLAVLHGRALRIMESALIELCWSTFEATEIRFWRPDFEKRPSKRKRARTPRGPPPLQTTTSRMGEREQEKKEEREGALHGPIIMAFPSLHDTREMADFVRESFRWH
ncbi:hypothetical protein Cgig2_027388 [Carnegiea gigantea]|uniref:Uncharacterized protein n=1 Tax=Carnegiea gigantea TaxID=171969 RepID=A0A9Q1K4X2_9CARY|nr:hypothetical protein Cgig2_027388 [Carnegiea gigantea]